MNGPDEMDLNEGGPDDLGDQEEKGEQTVERQPAHVETEEDGGMPWEEVTHNKRKDRAKKKGKKQQEGAKQAVARQVIHPNRQGKPVKVEKAKLETSIHARMIADRVTRNAIRIELATADGTKDRVANCEEVVATLCWRFKTDTLKGFRYVPFRQMVYVDCPTKEQAEELANEGLRITADISSDGYTKVLPVIASTDDSSKPMVVEFDADYGLTEQEKRDTGAALMEFCGRNNFVPKGTQVLGVTKVTSTMYLKMVDCTVNLEEVGFGVEFSTPFAIPTTWTDKNNFNFRIRVKDPCKHCRRRHDFNVCPAIRKKLQQEARELRRREGEERMKDLRKTQAEEGEKEEEDSDEEGEEKKREAALLADWTEADKKMFKAALKRQKEEKEKVERNRAALNKQFEMEDDLDSFLKDANNGDMMMDMDPPVPRTTISHPTINSRLGENTQLGVHPSTPVNQQRSGYISDFTRQVANILLNFASGAEPWQTPSKSKGKRTLTVDTSEEEEDTELANPFSKGQGIKYQMVEATAFLREGEEQNFQMVPDETTITNQTAQPPSSNPQADQNVDNEDL